MKRFLLFGMFGLAACGQQAQLMPAPGQPLPVKPLLAKATPTAEQLLTPPVNARPERIDELIKRSEPRRPDRFDLPPADGGLAPVLPDTEEPSSTEKTGVSDPR
ncbi:MAG TPA: hypothetical protein VGB39_07460 [Sphingomicrobium sp.]|jgi:hypothetical protein